MNNKIIFLIIAAFIINGCSYQEQNTKGDTTLTVKSIGNTTTQEYKVNGVNALDLLKFSHNVKLTFGNYLECIDDVCANKEYIWTFYVNGAKSPLGVKQYQVKSGDSIEFRFNKGG